VTVAVVVAVLVFTIAAGFNDGGNLLAIASSSRYIAPARAYVLIVACACIGPIVFGTAVARTAGSGIADFRTVGEATLLAAFAGALATIGAAYAARVPTSLTAALFSSMVGALWVGPGLAAVRWSGIEKVAISMAGSVVIGLIAGAVAYSVIAWILARVHRPIAERIISLQWLSAGLLAMGYGANDMEKSAGLLAAAVQTSTFSVPTWTLAVAACGFAAGLALGGVRVAKTIGGKLFSIRSHHALAAQSASAMTVIGAALIGGPLSTTDTSASSLVGVGAAYNPRVVRWRVVGEIAVAWIITIPAALCAGALAGVAVRAL
jgi:PiT family inorganic phosphate transporter